MLLPWRSSDPRNSDLDAHDEATVALLPKVSNDKIPNDATFREGSDDDDDSHVIDSKPIPWWSFIWVRVPGAFCLQKLTINPGLRPHPNSPRAEVREKA